jgi:hypothetical protein
MIYDYSLYYVTLYLAVVNDLVNSDKGNKHYTVNFKFDKFLKTFSCATEKK